MATDTGAATAAESLASHLVVALTALAAGIVAGGWLAFETGYWEGFKATIEGLASGGLLVAGGLLAVTAAVTLLATYRRTTA